MTPEDWPERLVVVDVEGNGQTPPDLIEIAILPVRCGQVDPDAAWQALIRPPRPVTSFAARVHGLTVRDLADAPPWAENAELARALLEDTWIAAHNAHVDYTVLARHLPGWQPLGVLDTLRLARRAYPGRGGHTLDALLTRTGIDPGSIPGRRHRASFDAHATARLLLALAGPYTCWADLAAAAVPPGLTGCPALSPDAWHALVTTAPDTDAMSRPKSAAVMSV